MSGLDEAVTRIPVRAGLPTTPPADAVLPERNPTRPRPASRSRATTAVLRLRRRPPERPAPAADRRRGPHLTGTFTVTDHHQGAPGLAHGGLLTTAFDDALGSLNWLLRRPAVTGRLETDFRRPVPVGSTLHIDAEVAGVRAARSSPGRSAASSARTARVAMTAAALFVQVPVEHF